MSGVHQNPVQLDAGAHTVRQSVSSGSHGVLGAMQYELNIRRTIEDVIKSASTLLSKEKFIFIVRREYVLKDTLKKMASVGFSPFKNVQVYCFLKLFVHSYGSVFQLAFLIG